MFSTALLCVALPPPWGDEPNQADDWGGFGDALVSDAPEVLLGFCFAPNLGDALLSGFFVKVAQCASNCSLKLQLNELFSARPT